jgi:hypothetical protein
LLLSDSCGFVHVEHPLRREDESVVYNSCWPSPAQSFTGPSPAGLMTIFYGIRFEIPAGPRIYILQEQDIPTILPGIGFPFRRLPRLAGLRYSNPPPHGLSLKPQFTSYLTGNTLRLRYKDQTVNAV